MNWKRVAYRNAPLLFSFLLFLSFSLFTGCGKAGLKNRIYRAAEEIERLVIEVDERLIEKEFGEVGESIQNEYILETRDRINNMKLRIRMRMDRLPDHVKPDMEEYYRQHIIAKLDELSERFPDAMYELDISE